MHLEYLLKYFTTNWINASEDEDEDGPIPTKIES